MRFLTTAWGQLVPVVLEELDVEAGLEADSVAAGFDSLEDDPPVDDESPEGAAATAAYDHLIATGFLKASDRVVIFNTGSGNKYTDVIGSRIG